MKNGSKNVAPGVTLAGGVLSIKHDREVSITEAANGDWIYQHASKSFVISSQDVDTITSIEVGRGALLDLSAKAVDGENFTITGAGRLNISGVIFTEAQGQGGMETNTELKNVDFNSIDATVNGSVADLLKARWEVLDDGYVDQGYYFDRNEAFVRLGLDYVAYLEAGGEPFTDFVAKTSGGRLQSLHDNLLGNLWGPAVEGRFTGALRDELLSLIPDEYEGRAYFDGALSRFGGPAHDAVRAFDYDHGWSRPDYLDRNTDGRVDARASQDRNGDGVDEQMAYGNGNGIDNWSLVRHEGAGVELAVKVKQFSGADHTPSQVDADGTVHFNVDEGFITTTRGQRPTWSFDYAATVLPSGDDDAFVFKVFYDSDPTSGVNLVDVSHTLAQYGANQNSQNYAFLDVDPATAGTQNYGFGDGEFTIELRAYAADGTTLLATNRVVVHVGDGDPDDAAAAGGGFGAMTAAASDLFFA